MQRSRWASGWRKPKLKWCERCGQFFLASDGECRRTHLSTNRVTIEPFEMVANPTIRWGDLGRTRYNVADRIRERMAGALLEQEEGAMFRMQQLAANLEQTQRPPLDWANNEER